MARSKFPSDDVDRLMLRLPAGMRDRIAKASAANGRSMNAEIVQALEDRYPPEVELNDLVEWIEEVVDHALNNDWRNSRKFLVEGLSELKERINAERFDPKSLRRDYLSDEPSHLDRPKKSTMQEDD